MTKPELLAPAGDWPMMRAAVANGADAVYFGLEDFNARRRAENFTLAGLGEVMDYLRAHNVRGYVAFNTLIFSDELPRADEFIEGIARAGADAVIVQDLGLARLIHRAAPTLPIHASTQMTQTHADGIAMLRELGVTRVILARELSLEQIGAIRRQLDSGGLPIELEVFVHGAMCISYSGQCLASEFLFGRSANRGQCGQLCRLPYRLLVDGELAGVQEACYLLSPQDLATHDLLGEFAGLGVAGLKIEGRLKGPHYVAAVVQAYRAAIDSADRPSQGQSARPVAMAAEHQRQLAQSFSRGFAHGFLDDPYCHALVVGDRPASRGIAVGVVVRSDNRGVVVELAKSTDAGALKPGDGIAFDNPAGAGAADNEFSEQDDIQGGRIYGVEPLAGNGSRVLLTFGRDDVDLRAIAIDSVVRKTDDPQLRRQLEASWSRDEVIRRAAVFVRIEGQVGGLLKASLRDSNSVQADATWDQPLQAARNRPLTTELVAGQFSRLGQTPFELAGAELYCAGEAVQELPVMVPKSVLNDLRRRLCEELQARRAERTRHEVVPNALRDLRRQEAQSPQAGTPSLHVLVRSMEQLDAILNRATEGGLRPAAVCCDFGGPRQWHAALAALRNAGVSAGIATQRIIRPGEEALLTELINCRPDFILVRNLTALALCRPSMDAKDATSATPASWPILIADHSLNVANELYADFIRQHGAARFTPSYDLDWPQLSAMLPGVDAQAVEVVIHHHVPMFHTQHCLAAARTGTSAGQARAAAAHHDHRCPDRTCQGRQVDLLDRIGQMHPVLGEPFCRNTVYSSHIQTGALYYESMRHAGLSHFRVELLRDTAGEAALLLSIYADLLAGDTSGEETWRRLKDLSPVTRGTWATL